MSIEEDLDFDDIFRSSLNEFEPEPTTEMKEFGRFVTTKREEKGLTQTALARETNLSLSTISELEQGQLSAPPSCEAIATLAQSLDVDEYTLSLWAGQIPEEMRHLICSFLIILETPEKADEVIDICCVAEILGAKVVIESIQ